MMINYYPKNKVFYYLIIKDLKILISTYNKNEKAKASHAQYF